MDEASHSIPRKIWIYWHQGLAHAPFVVKKCIDSWIRENPGWEIVILDKDSLHQYIDLDLPTDKLSKLDLAKQANLIRLQLLHEYGGVWVDATLYCIRPLDDWIFESAGSGFFAFYKPGPDRIISNWFLASTKASPIIVEWKRRYVSFFKNNTFNNDGEYKQRLLTYLARKFNGSEKTTKYWCSIIVRKIFRVYPYFISHYIFERVVSTNSECRKIWADTKKISAVGPHRIHKFGIFSPMDEKIKDEIDNKIAPLYKLTWKYDLSKYSTSSVLYYLLEGSGQRS
jgi:hypothetical protein